jgi:hypothetical protein
MESGRAPIWRWMGKWHGLVHCLAALAEVQALSAFLVLHAEPQSCARAGERRTVAFHFNACFNGAMLATMYLCYALDVTMSEAGVATVCERVLAGHCGLQRLSGLEPLLISSRVIAWMALCYCAWCHCLLVSTVKFQLCPCLRTLGRSLFVV